jgi:MarR family transcriptional regulator, transcriptional regulator for hemolysin
VDHADLGYLLQRTARMYRGRLAVALQPLQLTPQQASVLIAMEAAPGRTLTHRGVADAVDADVATTTGLLGRLERDGWILSAVNSADRRSKLFTLTPHASGVVPELMALARDASLLARETLSAEEYEELLGLLGRLADATRKGDAR